MVIGQKECDRVLLQTFDGWGKLTDCVAPWWATSLLLFIIEKDYTLIAYDVHHKG